MREIKDVKLKAIRDYSSADTLSDQFFVFDSYSEDIEDFTRMAVTDYPVRLDVLISIVCEEGTLNIRIGYTDYIISKSDFILIHPDRVFQVLEVSDDFKAKITCVKDGFFDFNDEQHSIKIQNLLKEYPCHSLPPS